MALTGSYCSSLQPGALGFLFPMGRILGGARESQGTCPSAQCPQGWVNPVPQLALRCCPCSRGNSPGIQATGTTLLAQVRFGLVCLAVCCALYQVLGRGRDQAPGANCLHVPCGQPRPVRPSGPVLKTSPLFPGTTTLGITNCAPPSSL